MRAKRQQALRVAASEEAMLGRCVCACVHVCVLYQRRCHFARVCARRRDRATSCAIVVRSFIRLVDYICVERLSRCIAEQLRHFLNELLGAFV